MWTTIASRFSGLRLRWPVPWRGPSPGPIQGLLRPSCKLSTNKNEHQRPREGRNLPRSDKFCLSTHSGNMLTPFLSCRLRSTLGVVILCGACVGPLPGLGPTLVSAQSRTTKRSTDLNQLTCQQHAPYRFGLSRPCLALPNFQQARQDVAAAHLRIACKNITWRAIQQQHTWSSRQSTPSK